MSAAKALQLLGGHDGKMWESDGRGELGKIGRRKLSTSACETVDSWEERDRVF